MDSKKLVESIISDVEVLRSEGVQAGLVCGGGINIYPE